MEMLYAKRLTGDDEPACFADPHGGTPAREPSAAGPVAAEASGRSEAEAGRADWDRFLASLSRVGFFRGEMQVRREVRARGRVCV